MTSWAISVTEKLMRLVSNIAFHLAKLTVDLLIYALRRLFTLGKEQLENRKIDNQNTKPAPSPRPATKSPQRSEKAEQATKNDWSWTLAEPEKKKYRRK